MDRCRGDVERLQVRVRESEVVASSLPRLLASSFQGMLLVPGDAQQI